MGYRFSAAASSSRKTVLIVPGFLAGIKHFEALAGEFAAAGYNAIVVERNAHGRYGSEIGDAVRAVEAAHKLVPTLIVAHSYGFIATEKYLMSCADSWINNVIVVGITPAGVVGTSNPWLQSRRFAASNRSERGVAGAQARERDARQLFRANIRAAYDEGFEVARYSADLATLQKRVKELHLITFAGDRFIEPERVEAWLARSRQDASVHHTVRNANLTHNGPIYQPALTAKAILKIVVP